MMGDWYSYEQRPSLWRRIMEFVFGNECECDACENSGSADE